MLLMQLFKKLIVAYKRWSMQETWLWDLTTKLTGDRIQSLIKSRSCLQVLLDRVDRLLLRRLVIFSLAKETILQGRLRARIESFPNWGISAKVDLQKAFSKVLESRPSMRKTTRKGLLADSNWVRSWLNSSSESTTLRLSSHQDLRRSFRAWFPCRIRRAKKNLSSALLRSTIPWEEHSSKTTRNDKEDEVDEADAKLRKPFNRFQI